LGGKDGSRLYFGNRRLNRWRQPIVKIKRRLKVFYW